MVVAVLVFNVVVVVYAAIDAVVHAAVVVAVVDTSSHGLTRHALT